MLLMPTTLKATALYINSSVARYAHFFNNAQWGISQAIVNPENVGAIPFANLSPEQIKKLADTANSLVEQERAHLAEHSPLAGEPIELQSTVDAVVERTLSIPDDICIAARDFMKIRYQLMEGNTGESASQPPNHQDLKLYAEQLRLQVDDYARRRHRIAVHAGQHAVIATVEVTTESDSIPVVIGQQWNSAAVAILDSVREQHSQWAYIQRSVRIYDGVHAFI